MHNINPTLIMGQTLVWLEKTGADIRPHELRYIEVRIYDPTGSGYYFTGNNHAVRWYYREGPDVDHFNRADSDAVQDALDAGAKIQVCGPRGASFGVWNNWGEFFKTIG